MGHACKTVFNKITYIYSPPSHPPPPLRKITAKHARLDLTEKIYNTRDKLISDGRYKVYYNINFFLIFFLSFFLSINLLPPVLPYKLTVRIIFLTNNLARGYTPPLFRGEGGYNNRITKKSLDREVAAGRAWRSLRFKRTCARRAPPLSPRLEWFLKKPLYNRRVAIVFFFSFRFYF